MATASSSARPVPSELASSSIPAAAQGLLRIFLSLTAADQQLVTAFAARLAQDAGVFVRPRSPSVRPPE
jgi:hypothetical protein